MKNFSCSLRTDRLTHDTFYIRKKRSSAHTFSSDDKVTRPAGSIPVERVAFFRLWSFVLINRVVLLAGTDVSEEHAVSISVVEPINLNAEDEDSMFLRNVDLDKISHKMSQPGGPQLYTSKL
jgi:hypothetical protein